METTTPHPADLAQAYEESVRREREAWLALQAQVPGSPERARAWDTWSLAIVHTNKAWRRLNASRLAHPAPSAAQPRVPPHAHA